MYIRAKLGAGVGALAVVVAGGLAGVLPAPAGASSVSASKTLHLAFGADMQVPDPDIFYEIEGNAVVTSVYEGLVKYADNSTKIIPALATSSGASLPNGKTYTFHLRSRAKFHDGTPVDSAAAEFSIERRKGVNSAPCVHGRRRHLDVDPRPAHLRGPSRQAGERLPRLPGRPLRAEDGQSDARQGPRDRREPRRLGAGVPEDPRRRDRSLHDQRVRARKRLSACRPSQGLLGDQGVLHDRATSRSSPTSPPSRSSSPTASSR